MNTLLEALKELNKIKLEESVSSFDNDVKDSYEALISSGKVKHPTIEDIFIDMSNPDNYNGIYADWNENPDPQVYKNARAAIVGAIGRLGIDDIADESLNENVEIAATYNKDLDCYEVPEKEEDWIW